MNSLNYEYNSDCEENKNDDTFKQGNTVLDIIKQYVYYATEFI